MWQCRRYEKYITIFVGEPERLGYQGIGGRINSKYIYKKVDEGLK
jgi:hypothetical protein